MCVARTATFKVFENPASKGGKIRLHYLPHNFGIFLNQINSGEQMYYLQREEFTKQINIVLFRENASQNTLRASS